MLDGEPFKAFEARKRIRLILDEGFVNYELPLFQQMLKKRGITIVDVINVLRAGQIQEAELSESGEWRHQVTTAKYCVVVEFEAEDEFVVVTAYKWGN